MEQPARFDIHADRWVSCVRTLAFVDFNFTSATFASHVRLHPDASGSPLATATVTLVYAGSATVSAHIAAGRLPGLPPGMELTDTIYVSQVRITIAEATMEAMPYPAELGDDMILYWDLHITPSGGTKDVYAAGKFIVRGGATQ
jgi:hypothetical protein